MLCPYVFVRPPARPFCFEIEIETEILPRAVVHLLRDEALRHNVAFSSFCCSRSFRISRYSKFYSSFFPLFTLQISHFLDVYSF